MARFVVGISGASGVRLAHIAIEEITKLGHNIELVISRPASLTIMHEMGQQYATPQHFIDSFDEEKRALIRLHNIYDYSSPIASGSYPHDGCLIIPCSMATIGAIACGLSDNVLRRAADVSLKERRRLVLVPRETPLHEIHLENMLKLAKMGATIFPPEPAWYMNFKSIDEMERLMVGRILDQLCLNTGVPRWGC